MIVIYRKDTGKVVHYAPYDGINTSPSLFGLYFACLKDNFPGLQLTDFDEMIVNERERDEDGVRLVEHLSSRICRVEGGKVIPGESIVLSPPPPTSSLEGRIAELEVLIAELRSELGK